MLPEVNIAKSVAIVASLTAILTNQGNTCR